MENYIMESNHVESGSDGVEFPIDTSSTALPLKRSRLKYEPLQGLSIISDVKFTKHPPENLRKCSFFQFTISISDTAGVLMEIQSASFLTFIEITEEDKALRNGMIYRLKLLTSEGRSHEEDIFIRLVDSSTKKPIAYEGTSKSPDLQRVLLTHVLICSRCCQQKSCGNKNETPSDPVIVDKTSLRIFLKCNQNCLKNAGNPSRTRRFQLAVYSSASAEAEPLALSEAMFVHNNSKHGKKVDIASQGLVQHSTPQMRPQIHAICPNEGWTTGGNLICIIGENFFPGLQVIFGAAVVPSSPLTSNAICTRVPARGFPGKVEIKLSYKGSTYCSEAPGEFIYITTNMLTVEQGVSRLAHIIKADKDMTIEYILQRAADILENASGSGQITAAPQVFNFPPSSYPSRIASFPFHPTNPVIRPPSIAASNQCNMASPSDISKPMSNIIIEKQPSCEVPFANASMDINIMGATQTGNLPRSNSVSDDAKSTHSCGSITPVSRCGSGEGLTHSHSSSHRLSMSSVNPLQYPTIQDQSPPTATPATNQIQAGSQDSAAVEYKPFHINSGNVWPNHQIPMRIFPPPNCSNTHPSGVQFGHIPSFQAVGMSQMPSFPDNATQQQGGGIDLASYRHLPLGVMALPNFNNNNNNNGHGANGNSPCVNDQTQSQPPSLPNPANTFFPQLMFPIAGSPCLTPVPAPPPQSPGIYRLPQASHSLPVSPTTIASFGIFQQRPLSSPFAPQTTVFNFPTVAQPQAGATPDQEATITFLPGGRKRKLMESGMTET